MSLTIVTQACSNVQENPQAELVADTPHPHLAASHSLTRCPTKLPSALTPPHSKCIKRDQSSGLGHPESNIKRKIFSIKLVRPTTNTHASVDRILSPNLPSRATDAQRQVIRSDISKRPLVCTKNKNRARRLKIRWDRNKAMAEELVQSLKKIAELNDQILQSQNLIEDTAITEYGRQLLSTGIDVARFIQQLRKRSLSADVREQSEGRAGKIVEYITGNC